MTSVITIWDWPLRVFHWLLVVVLVLAYWSGSVGGLLLEWHARFGALLLSLLCFRFCWGFLGTFHSRFKTFFPTPSRFIAYLSSNHNRYGHSPLAALSVIAMLIAVSIQSLTGLFVVDEDSEFYAPLSGWITNENQQQLTSWHVSWVNVVLFLISLHMLAISFHIIIKRKNIIMPMITGSIKVSGPNISESSVKVNNPGLIMSVLIAIIIFWLLMAEEY